MLHAVIFSEQEAFHLSAEVDGYNMQELGQHVRNAARPGRRVRVQVEIEPEDELAFARHTRGWLAGLRTVGERVEVEILPTGGSAPPGARRGDSDRRPETLPAWHDRARSTEKRREAGWHPAAVTVVRGDGAHSSSDVGSPGAT
jgi:hypothetical protein